MSTIRAAVTFRKEDKLGPYLVALERAGIEPVLNPDSLDSLDGLLLTGGSDINPARYGQQNSGSDEVDDVRDEREIRLVGDALRDDFPVLGICRGLQLLNVACAGSLIQHLDSTTVHRQRPKNVPSGNHPMAHSVNVEPGTCLAAIIGAGRHDVNSRHHQAVDRLGKELVVSARSEDGVVEGLEHQSATFVVAVQWHPEDRIFVSEPDRKLFRAFADALRQRSKASSPAAHREAPQPSW